MEKLFIYELLNGDAIYHINGHVTPATREAIEPGVIADWVEGPNPVYWLDDLERPKEATSEQRALITEALATHQQNCLAYELASGENNIRVSEKVVDYFEYDLPFMGKPEMRHHPLARSFINAKNLQALKASLPASNMLAALHDDPETLPPELDIANIAWRAVSNGFNPSNGTPRQQISDWLLANYPNLSATARDRIVTVCNWDKEVGRKS